MKRKSPKQLKDLADKLFSEFIRRKYADGNGIVKCYTCPNMAPWKELQNGHFVSRTHLSTRWDDRNCRPQCFPCNVWRRGNMDVFALKLSKEDPTILEELNRLRNQTKQMKRADYEALIEDLKNKLQALDSRDRMET